MKTDKYLSPKDFARLLRKNQTPEETVMWKLLRNRQLLGYKFLRQHPIQIWETNLRYHFYFADFYCAERKLVIEIDGLIHTLQEDYDKARDQVMLELRLTVLRVTNKEVVHDLDGVLERIRSYLTHPLAPSL